MLDAVCTLNASHVVAIPVVDADSNLKGIFSQGDVIRLLAQGRDLGDTQTDHVVEECSALAPDEVIDDPQQAMVDGLPLAPVVEDGKLISVVTPMDVTAQRHVAALLGNAAPNLITTISPNDDMYFNSKGSYLQAGADALVRIRQAMGLVGKTAPRKILDMPGGHGRVLRFLKAGFPDAELTACDIKKDGVDFCAETFGANPVYSEEDFSAIRMDDDFDLIWVGSLFTHLDRSRWLDLLMFLKQHLAAGGLLVFTAFGRLDARSMRRLGMWEDQIERIVRDSDREGFSHQEYKSAHGWGLTFCSQEFVHGALEQPPALDLVSHVSQGWLQQDVVACTKP